MKNLKKLVVLCVVYSIALYSPAVRAVDALDDTFTQISPNSKGDDRHFENDEFFHGRRHGRILMRVLMLGAIGHPGVHYFAEGTDLLFAVTYAGGTNQESKTNGITIRRRGIRNLIEVDLDELLLEGAPIPKLLDGDLVQIPYNWRRDYQTLQFYISAFTTITTFGLVLLAFTRSSTYTSSGVTTTVH